MPEIKKNDKCPFCHKNTLTGYKHKTILKETLPCPCCEGKELFKNKKTVICLTCETNAPNDIWPMEYEDKTWVVCTSCNAAIRSK